MVKNNSIVWILRYHEANGTPVRKKLDSWYEVTLEILRLTSTVVPDLDD